ncbi:aldo/keto reductase, partial [Aeromicrobium sp.]|nr:aldo/keto reductase [Candidatus Saccharibacteria bacterium]
LGFGVYQIEPENAAEVIGTALEAGFRHIDTAEMYQNEQQVGEAVKNSGINRSQIHITSKLNNGHHEPEAARRAFAETLEKLGDDYIDLFIIHWPLPTKYDGDFVQTWNTLLEFKKEGRARSVGVSNFQVSHLQKLMDETGEKPSVNQIELHPYFQNREVVQFCQDNGIAIEAWSPIAQGDVLEDAALQSIADAHGKSAAQVTLRWHIQHGFIIFPKSSTPERIAENFDIFDFELSPDEMSAIDALDKGEAGRNGPNPDTFDMIPA